MSMFQSLFQSIPSITLDGAAAQNTNGSSASKSAAAFKTTLTDLFMSLSTSNAGDVMGYTRSLTAAPGGDRRTKPKSVQRERSPSLLDNAALFLQSLSIGNSASRQPRSSPRRLANGVKRRQSTMGDRSKSHSQSLSQAQTVNMIQMDTFLSHNHDTCACLKAGTQTYVLKSLSVPEESLPEKLTDMPYHIFAHPPHRCLVRHDKMTAEIGLRNGGSKTQTRRNGHRLSTTTKGDGVGDAAAGGRVDYECCDPVADCAAAYYMLANCVNGSRREREDQEAASCGQRALIHKTSSGEQWVMKDSGDVHLKTWIDRYDPEAYHNAAVKSDVILLANSDEDASAKTLDVTTVHALMTCLENLIDNGGVTGSKLDREWIKLQHYEELVGLTEEIRIARLEENEHKNFDDKFLPYDHSRVVLGHKSGISLTSDYINASYITDYDPAKPRYIAAQSPLCSTLMDFWQMIWENECTSIVNLCSTGEMVASVCDSFDTNAQTLSDANNNNNNGERRALVRYWPKQGAELYDSVEVHLVAEHVVHEQHLVIRSFYVAHTGTKRSRTVTQFNYLSWPERGSPGSVSALLDLRKRLHRSDHSGAPILVHCSDGSGRSGAFILIDMFLSSVASESMREFSLIGAIEHLRDQRMGMVSTRTQFDSAILAIVSSIEESLKARASAESTRSVVR